MMLSIGIVGISGFSRVHLDSIAYWQKKNVCSLDAALVHPDDSQSEKRKELEARGVRIHHSLDEMLDKGKNRLNLISVTSGIEHHEWMSCRIMEAGVHVFCEKPAAGTAGEARRMLDVSKAQDRILAVGYQHLYSPAIQRIKEIRIRGILGKLIRGKMMVSWARTSGYYGRNSWAGKEKIGDRYIYDSPLQNGNAHFLQNLLYIAGSDFHESAQPAAVYGENYSAQDIECADTQFMRVLTSEGVELLFWATHAVKDSDGPRTRFIFEKGYIDWSMSGEYAVYEVLNNQKQLVEKGGNGNLNLFREEYRDLFQAVREENRPLCHIGNAVQQAECITASFKSSDGVSRIPGEYRRDIVTDWDDYVQEDTAGPFVNTVIDDMDDILNLVWDKECGFSEAGLPWGRGGETVDL